MCTLHAALAGRLVAFEIAQLRLGVVATYVAFVIAAAATVLISIGLGKAIRLVPPLAFVLIGVPMSKSAAGRGKKQDTDQSVQKASCT